MSHNESTATTDAEADPNLKPSESDTDMEPANKKADDDAIRAFVADSETGVIATEVAGAFDLGETTVREALSRLEDRGEITSRKASVIRLFYVPADDREQRADAKAETTESAPTNEHSGENAEASTPSAEDTTAAESASASEGVAFLTDAQRAYLTDGTLGENTEPDILERLREHFAKTLWQTPCVEGLDRGEIELLARRLDIPSEEVPTLRPNELFDRIDRLAVSIGTPIDRLYSTFRTPSMDILRWIRHEKLDCTQSEVADRLAEDGDLSQSSYITRLSQWESEVRTISEEDRARLTDIYQDIYAEDHDPYQLREEWE